MAGNTDGKVEHEQVKNVRKTAPGKQRKVVNSIIARGRISPSEMLKGDGLDSVRIGELLQGTRPLWGQTIQPQGKRRAESCKMPRRSPIKVSASL